MVESIIPENDNPTFVTYNFKLFVVAVWSWDDGNELDLGTSTHKPSSSKSLDLILGTEEKDDNDIMKWEFYYTKVQPGPHQEEKKDEDDDDSSSSSSSSSEEEEEKEKPKTMLPKMLNNVINDSKNMTKNMIDGSKNVIVGSANISKNVIVGSANMSKNVIVGSANLVADGVEKLNPIQMFHKKSPNQTQKKSASLSAMPITESSSQSDAIPEDREDRKDMVGQAMEEALSKAKKTFTLSSGNTSSSNEGSASGSWWNLETKGVKNVKPKHNDVHAFKDEYGSVMDIKFTNPIALAKIKAFKAQSERNLAAPKTPQQERKVLEIKSAQSERSLLKDIPNIPAIPENTTSPEVTRKTLPNFMSDPINKSAVRKKRASKKSKLQKALEKSNLLRPNNNEDDDDDVENLSVATEQITRRSGGRKKSKGGRRSQSLGRGDDDNDNDSDDDSFIGAMSTTKNKKKSSKRSSSASNKNGKTTNKSNKLKKMESARDVEGERRVVDDDDDDDESIIVESSRPSSTRTVGAFVSPRGAGKKKIKSGRRVPKLRKQKSEADVADEAAASKRKSKKKDNKKMLEALNDQMKKSFGVGVDGDDANSVKSSGGLEERRRRKRESEGRLKQTFDKIKVDKALGGAMDATKAVGKGAMDVTVGVTKGALDVTKSVGKGALDVTKTVGKGAMDVTMGVGMAIGVTKSTSTAPEVEVTRTE